RAEPSELPATAGHPTGGTGLPDRDEVGIGFEARRADPVPVAHENRRAIMERRSQRWILDTLLGVGGIGVLHPESQGAFEQMGYDHADLVRVYSQAKAGAMLPKAWTTTAQQVERRAQYAEERGYKITARDLYQRAAQLYGRAQYGFFRDDPRKTALHAKMVDCSRKVMAAMPNPVERVEIPFEGKTIYCVLHLPAEAKTKRVPVVLLLPGMDMFKEDWHPMAQRHLVPRGLAGMAIDGPGQGETLLHGVKVTVDNYERAAKAVLDYLVKRPEIDPASLVLLGVSMGSYWGTRLAAFDDRIKGAATVMGCYALDNMDVIFNVAQPSFKLNFMYMAGISDEAEFDEKVTKQMGLRNSAPEVKCPLLMCIGEFDELLPLEEALAVYDLVRAPKEIWVYEQEFHPLGNVSGELFSSLFDWLLGALASKYQPGMDNRIVLGRDGSHVKGSGRPAWWLA
ncbi:MAG: alpha/beta fold hydrolase, partial [Dehalococcoidia bacterium]|nr:alpha/beta fold hydrolase [Dehalococcoidia bacterium]